MVRHVSVFGLLVAAVAGLSAPVWSQQQGAGPQPASEEAKTFTFDGNEPLAGWTIKGDVTVDVTKGRQPNGSSLKVGPNGKALLKLDGADFRQRVESMGVEEVVIAARSPWQSGFASYYTSCVR